MFRKTPNLFIFSVLTANPEQVMLRACVTPGRKANGVVRTVPQDSSDQVTQLLVRWRGGDREALDALMPIVYADLRRMARQYLQRERHDHTLQSTALVHEAYVRLIGQKLPEWQNRAHFFGVAARLMRQILVEYARSHQAAKRGGGVCKVTLNEDLEAAPKPVDLDVIMLDAALKGLALLDEQQSRIVELRF